MDPDEEKIKSYLEGLGLTAARFSKVETCAGKTPDFRVFRNGELVFYCEVKSSPKDGWLDRQLNGAASGELVGGARNDPTFNRLTKDIHEAVKQFDAVNKELKLPNVLALVNHDNMCGFNDLLGVLTGNFYTNDGTIHPIYKQFSHGRIRDEKARVHMFVWLDDHRPNQLLFSQTDKILHSMLCAMFCINQNDIKQIAS